MQIATFTPRPPYDFTLTAAYARFYTVYGRASGSTYRKLLRLANAEMALVELRGVGSVTAPRIAVYLLAASGSPDADAVAEQAAHICAIDSDLAPFWAWAPTQPALWAAIGQLYGVHCWQTPTVFEALAITVNEQQIALVNAQRGERWLGMWSGDGLLYDGDTYTCFPPAARLAAATVDELRPLKITFGRMARLIALAQSDLSASFDELRAVPADDAYRRLRAHPGVGHWTAAWTVTRALGRYVYVGAADVALRAAVNRYLFGQAGRCPPDHMDDLFASYGEHAGAACFFVLMRYALDKYAAS